MERWGALAKPRQLTAMKKRREEPEREEKASTFRKVDPHLTPLWPFS